MKTRALLVLLSIAGLALVWSCATMQRRVGVAIEDEHGIVIPATPFTEADQASMNSILAKYDKSLYRIETHVNGQFQERQGTLRDIFTDKKLAASIQRKLNKQGFTRSAIRIGAYAATVEGATNNSQHVAGPSATPVGSGSNPQHVAGPSATPVGSGSNPQRVAKHPNNPAGSGSNPQRIQQQKLICELRPILEKYNKP
jgi:hypothetical protein